MHLAALIHYMPPRWRRLPLSLRLMVAWNRLELLARAFPISKLVAIGSNGPFKFWGYRELSYILGLAY
jgi:hypothetical protein